MKDVIREIFDNGADGISFLPVANDRLQINGFAYAKRYKHKITPLGNSYHILLYKINEYGKITHNDNFAAILTDPRVYVENIIKHNFYGIVVKETAGSKKFISEMYQKILKSV